MTDDWDYAWTFAKSLLFTITIMTTIGMTTVADLKQSGSNSNLQDTVTSIPQLLPASSFASDTPWLECLYSLSS